MDICNLNNEIEDLESTEDVDSAQAAAATLHTDWVDVNFRNTLSNFLEGKPGKRKAYSKYYQQGEPRKSDYQTDLIQICQIYIIVVQYIRSDKAEIDCSTRFRTEFRLKQFCLSGS